MTLRAAVAALFLPCALLAQSRITVPVQDPVYRDVDRLIALRLVEVGLYGQRPYSRRELARLTREAGASIQRREVSHATRAIVERLSLRFADDVRQLDGVDPLRSGWRINDTFDAVRLPGSPRGIPTDQLGSVAASINPQLNGRSGRVHLEGLNIAYEPRGEVQAGRVGVVVQPRLLVLAQDLDTYGSLETGSATIPIRNVTIEAGRQPIVWGQGMEGGLLFSSSGRPLDMLRISTDLPFRGWFLKGTSPMRGSLVAAHLGPNQHFPNSFLIAYKLSGHPFTNRVELAASVLAVQGGRGAPRGSFGDHVMDLIPALKYLLPDNTTQFSNKMAGWEYRLRLPELRGLQLYAEHAFDDMDPRRWKSTFWEDGGHIVGASVSDLGGDGALSAAWEFHHTGLRYYKHGVFRSGMAFNGTLFGDPLGNQGNGTYLRLTWDRGGRRTWALNVAVERRTGDEYGAVSEGPDEDNFRFIRLNAYPAEWRQRVDATWRIDRTTSAVSLTGGYERVRDFEFKSRDNRHHVLLGVSIQNRIAARSQRP